MTNPIFESIVGHLDLVVLERLPHGMFLRLGAAPPPSWFGHVLTPKENEPLTVGEALPFVGHFLDEAEAFWREGREGRLRSEAFTIADASGADVALTASALAVGHRQILLLEPAADFDERRRALQSARETVLEHEADLGRTRALLPRIETARTLTEQLANSGLTAGQHQVAVEIGEQLGSLAAAVEALAPLPEGVTRGRRR